MELNEFINTVTKVKSQMLRQAQTYLRNTEDAEDVVQEALAKLWQMRQRIDNAEKMAHLASVIVKNTSLNSIRNRKRETHLCPPCEVGSLLVSSDTPQRQLEYKETHQRLQQAITQLPDKQRAVVRMRNVEQLSYTEIAQVLGTTESSVRAMICKARATLMRQLTINNGVPLKE